MDIKVITRRYREKGIKVTPQRLAILKSLEDDKTHPSAYEIYRRLKKIYPGLSLTTVYNTIEVLKKMGEIVELNFYPEKALYDPNIEPHDHIYCVKCERVEDLHVTRPAFESMKEAEKRGYKVYKASTSFYGVCRECQEKEDRSN